uniref:Uncharacterized protein n=1 Tax=Lotus japonicus TaxID=34305 RepID=I3SC74_LOTJA|nr:unknown [Lotus japonicus]
MDRRESGTEQVLSGNPKMKSKMVSAGQTVEERETLRG